jgi:uncharacterized membrane protein
VLSIPSAAMNGQRGHVTPLRAGTEVYAQGSSVPRGALLLFTERTPLMDGEDMAEAANRMHVEVGAPAAFERWSDPGQLLIFLDGVRAVESIAERRQHWVAEIDGQVEEWDADLEIVEGQSIVWRGTDGKHTREVTFSAGDDGDGGTIVGERMVYEPSDIPVGALGIGVVARTVSNDLWRFKVLVEQGRSALEEQTAMGQPLEGASEDYVPASHVASVDDLPCEIVGTSIDRAGREAGEQDPAEADENDVQASPETAADTRRAYDWTA